MKMFKWQQTNKHVLSIYLKQNNSRASNFSKFCWQLFDIWATLEHLLSKFWVYCEATIPEFVSTIYSCLTQALREREREREREKKKQQQQSRVLFSTTHA